QFLAEAIRAGQEDDEVGDGDGRARQPQPCRCEGHEDAQAPPRLGPAGKLGPVRAAPGRRTAGRREEQRGERMVKIRRMRMGAAKRPFYRVVVSDSRSPRDGRFIENIGKYHPLEDPSLIQIDEERALYWLSEGAQPTEQVQNLLKVQGIW